MTTRTEKFGSRAMVKGAMLQAHLSWAESQGPEALSRIQVRLGPETARLVTGQYLVTDWLPFRQLIEIDRAIAAEVGGTADNVYRRLGRHSAERNLTGVYKSFIVDEPHRFFERGARLHDRFMNFGRNEYERSAERSCRLRLSGYEERSPVFCASGAGCYEGVLELMRVPGPVRVSEWACQCAGDPACVFELDW